jgi:hypothetical protein
MNTNSLNDNHPVPIPEPGFPMLTRMISDPVFPAEKGKLDEPVMWTVGRQHPFVPEMSVVRMFVDRGGVEIYSVSNDNTSGARTLIPMDRVRLIEEAMPIDIFVDEIDSAENDDEPDEPNDPKPSPSPSPNGGEPQTVPS